MDASRTPSGSRGKGNSTVAVADETASCYVRSTSHTGNVPGCAPGDGVPDPAPPSAFSTFVSFGGWSWSWASRAGAATISINRLQMPRDRESTLRSAITVPLVFCLLHHPLCFEATTASCAAIHGLHAGLPVRSWRADSKLAHGHLRLGLLPVLAVAGRYSAGSVVDWAIA